MHGGVGIGWSLWSLATQTTLWLWFTSWEESQPQVPFRWWITITKGRIQKENILPDAAIFSLKYSFCSFSVFSVLMPSLTHPPWRERNEQSFSFTSKEGPCLLSSQVVRGLLHNWLCHCGVLQGHGVRSCFQGFLLLLLLIFPFESRSYCLDSLGQVLGWKPWGSSDCEQTKYLPLWCPGVKNHELNLQNLSWGILQAQCPHIGLIFSNF